MLSINPYDETKCREVVSRYLDKIQEAFGKRVALCYDRSIALEISRYPRIQNFYHKHLGLRTSRCVVAMSIFSCAVFYYFDILLANKPSSIIDIGCGENYFKDILPNLHGVDPISKYSDETAMFHSAYAKENANKFECAFSINAIHFISLVNFKEQIELFASMIKPSGRGMVLANSARMVEKTTEKDLNRLFGTTNPDPIQIENYIDAELAKINLNFLVLETLITENSDDYLDGNIRMVFQV